jgi:hypothetical protein
MNDGSERIEIKLAHGFNDVVASNYEGPAPAADIAGGCATLLIGYLSQLNPDQRMLILSGFVDTMLRGFSDNCDSDLEYTH